MKNKLLQILFDSDGPVGIKDYGLFDAMSDEQFETLYDLIHNMLTDFIEEMIRDVDDPEMLKFIIPTILFDFERLYDVIDLNPRVFAEELHKLNFYPDSFEAYIYEEEDEMGIEFASEISPQELLVSAVVFARAILDEQAIRVFLADMLSSYLYPDFDDGDEYLSGEMES